jgi:hypothetical protein
LRTLHGGSARGCHLDRLAKSGLRSRHELAAVAQNSPRGRSNRARRHGVLCHAVSLTYGLANYVAACPGRHSHKHNSDLPPGDYRRAGEARPTNKTDPLPDLQRLRCAAARVDKPANLAFLTHRVSRQAFAQHRGRSRRSLGAHTAQPRSSFAIRLISRMH